MEIHFEIENKCLLKCRHCSSNATSKGVKFDYPIEQMLELLSAIPEEKTVFFTGGEPLLYKNLDTLLSSIKKLGNIAVGFFTSGVVNNNGSICPISKKHAGSLAEAGLKICYFSVYSHDAKVHDWMTQTPGSYNITQESIKALKDEGIEIRFNTVISKVNKDCMNKILQLASLWNASEVRLLKLIKHGQACFCWNEIGIGEEEYRKAVKEMLSEKHAIKITASSAIDLIACRPIENAIACEAGSKLLYVTFNGDIYPCASVKNNSDFCIGNIRETNRWAQYLEEKNHIEKNNCVRKYFGSVTDVIECG